jgi:hypothetical protein
MSGGGYAFDASAGGYLFAATATAGGGGGGVTGSSDSSLTIAGADAVINRATAGNWTASHTFTSSSVPVTSTVTDAGTNTQIEALRVAHTTSATAANGIGAYISFQDENGSGNLAEAGQLRGILRAVTNGAESGVLALYVAQAAAQTLCGWATSGQWYAPTLALGSLDSAGATTQTAQIQIVSTMVEYKSNNAGQGGHKFIGTTNVSGSRSFYVITPSSNTGSTAATEVKFYDYQTHTHQFASNTTVATERAYNIAAPTLAFATAGGVVSDAGTLYVSGAPIAGTNCTITRPYSFWTGGGQHRMDNIAITSAGGGATATLGTIGGSGPTTAAQSKWVPINLDGTNYWFPVWV